MWSMALVFDTCRHISRKHRNTFSVAESIPCSFREKKYLIKVKWVITSKNILFVKTNNNTSNKITFKLDDNNQCDDNGDGFNSVNNVICLY